MPKCEVIFARALNRGGLPSVYPSNDYVEALSAYTALYLKEEIQNEALTRKVAQFSEFLDLMALSNGQEISYQSLAGDCGVLKKSPFAIAAILAKRC